MNCMYLQNLVRLTSDNTPEIFWNGNWIPICGHDFWNTNHDGHQISIALFCQELGFQWGSYVSGATLTADALRIGYCVIEDANVWPYCTGGGNQHMGTATEVGSNGCQAGQGGGVVVECTTTATTTTTTTTTATTTTPTTSGRFNILTKIPNFSGS